MGQSTSARSQPDATTIPTTPVAGAFPAQTIEGCNYLALIIPSDEGELQAQAMENWFQACSSDEPFALELIGTRREQGFVLRASSEAQLSLLCKQFQAQYPQAEIQRIVPGADPLLLRPGEHAVIGKFGLAKPAWMPIKMFPAKALTEAGGDPLANLLAAMETVGSGERIVSQLALVRAPDDWIGPALRKAVEHPLQGERDQFAAQLKGGDTSGLARGWRIFICFFSVLIALWGYRWYREEAFVPLALLGLVALLAIIGGIAWWIKKGQTEIYDMKLVSDKLMRSAFYLQLRVVVIGREVTSSIDQLQEHLKGMEIAYRQFSLASANSLVLQSVFSIDAFTKQAKTLCRPEHAFSRSRSFLRHLHPGWSRDICNSLELSGLFHLPQQYTDLPLVRRISVKHLLFSPEVADAISRSQDPLPPVNIGTSSHRSYAVKVLLPHLTQLAHKFLVGRSRYGKSVLLQLLAAGVLQPVRDGSLQPGLFVIDPHRDLVFDLLKLIPKHRANDVLLLDFTDSQHIVGLNPLDATQGLSRDQMVSSLMNAFEKIWEKYWGPRMAFFLKNICLLLITLNFKLCGEGKAHEQYTLLDINPVLQYKDYATLVLNQLDRSETWHQELMAWFQHTYWTLPSNSSFRQEIILPILSKMSVFNDNMQLRRIFSQSITTASVHEAITAGKIVLCALSSRDMDEASVNILGSSLINTLHYAFTRQQGIPLTQRRMCAVFVDELQNFSGSAFDKLLSEDAKWGCSALFTTQSLKRLNQIKEGLQEMLLSNCDNLFVFNVSAADAKLLEAEFQGRVSQKHIISQPRLHCYARIAIHQYPQQFASLSLARPESWDASQERRSQAENIRRQSLLRFMLATNCDSLHEAHLKKFLDVSLFADRIEKEAESIETRRKQREEEQQREAGVPKNGEQTGKDPSANSDTSTEAPGKNGQTGGAQRQETTPSKANTSPQAPSDTRPEERTSKRKRTRSRRMRKLKKNPVGTPPPGLEGWEADSDEIRPLPASPPSSSSWGVEGRERERGA
jgi:hypothetical protein